MATDQKDDIRPRDEVAFGDRVARVVFIVQDPQSDGFLVQQTPDSGWEFVARDDVHDVIPAEDRAPRDRVAECANCRKLLRKAPRLNVAGAPVCGCTGWDDDWE